MREIKFRAWDEQNKVMHNEVEFIRSGIDGNDWILFKSDKQKLEDGNVLNNPYFQQQIKLMQYTGLKDKNGVEIYESDICRCLGGSEFNGHYEYNRIYEVKWQGSGLEMMIDNCGYGWNYSSGFDYIEVIGNIYEDSHLLDNN